jgi:hypothetical protein
LALFGLWACSLNSGHSTPEAGIPLLEKKVQPFCCAYFGDELFPQVGLETQPSQSQLGKQLG